MSGISATGGTMQFPKMTKELDPKEYASAKAYVWLSMMNEDGMRPTKWSKPNKNGTRVNFATITSQEEYDLGVAELKVFLSEAKKEFPDIDITIGDKEEEETNDGTDNG